MCDAVFDQQDAEVCVESWTVGLLYRCWEQLLLTKETLRCGRKRFSAEEMNLRFTSVRHHSNLHPNITVLTKTVLNYCVLVCFDISTDLILMRF